METTIPYDLARLAAAAYLLGPLGAALLLVVELENDYVRYHAWQVSPRSIPLILTLSSPPLLTPHGTNAES